MTQNTQAGRSDKSTQHLIADAAGIASAVALLRAGQLVSFPTETVYGLGADARDSSAVAGIFAAKNRPNFNPLIVHVADVAAASKYVEMDARAAALTQFWPGPLTLVLPRKSGTVSDLVSAGLDTLAIRIPAHPVAQALLRAFDGPIAAPSANPSGRISPTTATHVLGGLSGRIAAVLDGGPCAVGVESTIIGFNPAPTLLRPGGLSVEDIEAALGQSVQSHTGSINAPGQMTSHYAPNAALRLNVTAPELNEVWIGFGPNSGTAGWTLSENGDVLEAAANLFAMLRRADAQNQPIAVAPIPHSGLGLAINDRLTRAAAPRG